MAIQALIVGAVTLLSASVALAQSRACMLDGFGLCTTTPCAGGALEAWQACFASVLTEADCAPGCEFLPFEGLDGVPGFCAAPGFGGTLPADLAQTIADNDCVNPANSDDPVCTDVLAMIITLTGCDDECESENNGIANTCAANVDGCTGEAPSCDVALAPFSGPAAGPSALSPDGFAADAPGAVTDPDATGASATDGETATDAESDIATPTGSGAAMATAAVLALVAAVPLLM